MSYIEIDENDHESSIAYEHVEESEVNVAELRP